MASEFLFDLKHPETTWRGSSKTYFPNGDVSSEAGLVTDPEGPHRLYWVLDTVMHKVPEGTELDAVHMPHFHRAGYETFFVDSGSVWIYINGQKALAKKGDIVHLQAGQAHGMGFCEEVKWRGTYHDYVVPNEMNDVLRVMAHMPERKDDPELVALNPGMDNTKLERMFAQEVPAEQCMAIKNPARPHAAYEFPGLSFRVVVERWENGGTKELCCAIAEPGFTAEWVKYPPLRELFYVRKGKVKFTIMGEEVIADDECVVNVPKFAPHSLEVLEQAEIYELGGQSMWSLFLQNYSSIRCFDPERFAKPETVEALKQKFNIPVARIGMK